MIKLKSQSYPDKFFEYASLVCQDEDGNPAFILDSENKQQLQKCFDVITNNERGLMIGGNPGSGKTIFFEITQRILNPRGSRMFQKLHVNDVVLMFNNKEVGHSVFSKWKEKNVLFDDLGTEDKGHLFGEKIEVLEKFIQFRYDLFRYKGIKTHFTTNLLMDELNQRYGLRCISRLKEMCDVVVLGGSVNYTDRRNYRNFKGFPMVFHEKSKDEKEWEERYKQAKEAIALIPQSEIKRETLGDKFRKQFNLK